MAFQHTTSIKIGAAFGELTDDERALLEQMTAPFAECSDCGCDGLYLTIWTPQRTVQRIVCAVCLAPFWTAPGAVQ